MANSEKPHSEKPQRQNRLIEIEREVHAEAREWERQRLEKRLQEEADRDGKVFPPQPKKGAAPSRKGDAAANRRRDG
jgi:hypothetical protein